MAKLVGNRYAVSLFQAGIELEKIEEFHKELNFMGDILNKESKLFQILKHPRINKVEKKEIIDKVFRKDISQEIKNFFYIIIDKRRENSILEIVDEFNIQYNEYKNIVNVEAITAVEMDDRAKENLIKNLQKKMNKTIILTNKVDKSIIGGVILKLNNQFMDNTLKTQLETMNAHIKGVSL